MDELIKPEGNNLLRLLHGKSAAVSMLKPFERDIFLFDTYVAGTTHIEGIEELEPYLNIDDRLEFLIFGHYVSCSHQHHQDDDLKCKEERPLPSPAPSRAAEPSFLLPLRAAAKPLSFHCTAPTALNKWILSKPSELS